ncbi:hypothetical protein [Marinomonas algicola]|uniref:hypothetical protein n=1 Tax=Marinomonas algicola TaxID=2773454 RepID=UPI00174EA159|nr:hypothetical protein [Marinomonas algicola]
MHNLKLKVEDSLSIDTRLWRYIDLAKFVSLLDSGSLWLARSDTFRDQSEGRFPSEMRVAIERAYESFDDQNDSPINSADDFQEYLCRNSYVSCWHKNIDENMVMWELYGRDSNAVAVQTTVGKLESNISKIDSGGLEFYLKNVQYSRAEDVEGKLDYSAPFFIKRPHFNFEKEARILLSTYSAIIPNKDTPLGVTVKLNVVEAIEKILVHPDSQDWFVKVVQSISDKYGLNAPVERGVYGNKI